MKPWGAILTFALLCGAAGAQATEISPERTDLIGLLLDDPIGFALETAPSELAESEPQAGVGFDGGVSVGIDAPPEPLQPPAELAARAFDITYTFAYPDSVRRAGADR
jgi:hypothetical protein